jgi:hypothetical protein
MRRFSALGRNNKDPKSAAANPRLKAYLPPQDADAESGDASSERAQSLMASVSDAASTTSLSRASDGEQEVRAFLWACANGKQNIVAAFVSDDAAASTTAKAGAGKARHVAGMLRNPDVARSLLGSKHVSASIKDNVAIGIACKHGHLGVLNVLLECPDVNPGARDNYAIQAAAEHGYPRVVERLLRGLKSKQVDPSANRNFAIQAASFAGHSEVVKVLLTDSRVHPASGDNYAFRFACENGHLATVECLLRDPRVDPTARNNAAIRWAAANGHRRIVQVLLNDKRVDPAACNNEAITWANRNGHNLVATLLTNDARTL